MKSELKCNGNVWLHKIKHKFAVSLSLLEEKRLLSTGASGISTPEFINAVRDKETGGLSALEKKFTENGWEIKRSRYNLLHFVAEMKEGDWVVVPTRDKCFSVYEIVGERPRAKSEIVAECPEVESVDLGFFWNVKPIAEGVSKEKFVADAALTGWFKIRGTNACITRLKQSVEAAVIGWVNNEPFNLHRKLMDELSKLLLDIILSTLNPDKFEELVAWYFKRIGAKVDRPSKRHKSQWADADVTATFEDKTIIYAQVKFHKGKEDDWVVKQISRYKSWKDAGSEADDDATIAQVISTATYSHEAIKQTEEAEVELIDGPTFARMLLEAGFEGLTI